MAGKNGGARPGAGRKKGVSTLLGEKVRAKIAEMVEKEVVPMTKAQIKKAVNGDTQAYKELMDRGFGKVKEHVDVTTDGEKIVFVPFELHGKRNLTSSSE